MNKFSAIIFSILIFSFLTPMKVLSDTYQIEGTFDGCEYDKYYPLTNGMFLRCEGYNYSYDYYPAVIANGNQVYSIGTEQISATIVQGNKISTQIDGEWEGCDFDTHRLTNGYYLSCNSYFYEYAYMPLVEILVIDGVVKSVKINGQTKDGVSVFSP